MQHHGWRRISRNRRLTSIARPTARAYKEGHRPNLGALVSRNRPLHREPSAKQGTANSPSPISGFGSTRTGAVICFSASALGSLRCPVLGRAGDRPNCGRPMPHRPSTVPAPPTATPPPRSGGKRIRGFGGRLPAPPTAAEPVGQIKDRGIAAIGCPPGDEPGVAQHRSSRDSGDKRAATQAAFAGACRGATWTRGNIAVHGCTLRRFATGPAATD